MYSRREMKEARSDESASILTWRAPNQDIFSCLFVSNHGTGKIPRFPNSAGFCNILVILIVYIVINLRPVNMQRKYCSI